MWILMKKLLSIRVDSSAKDKGTRWKLHIRWPDTIEFCKTVFRSFWFYPMKIETMPKVLKPCDAASQYCFPAVPVLRWPLPKEGKRLGHILTYLTASVVDAIDSALSFPLWTVVFPLWYVRNTFRNVEEMCRQRCPSEISLCSARVPAKSAASLWPTFYGWFQVRANATKVHGSLRARWGGKIQRNARQFFSPADLCPQLCLSSLWVWVQKCKMREEGCLQTPSLMDNQNVTLRVQIC